MQPQALVLTIFGSYAREPGRTVWSGGLVELLEDLGFSVQAARAALARLVSRQLLSRHRHGRLVSYALTARAEHLMAEGDRRIFTFGRSAPPGNEWTMVWHTLPDARRIERSRFASRLRFLGFGSLEGATWIAASDREAEALQLANELRVSRYIAVMVGRLAPALPASALVAQAWDLDAVRESYEAFLLDFECYRDATARQSLDGRAAFNARTLLMHRFRSFPSTDPELPAALGGDEPLRQRVIATFDDVYVHLSRSAQEYFQMVAEPH